MKKNVLNLMAFLLALTASGNTGDTSATVFEYSSPISRRNIAFPRRVGRYSLQQVEQWYHRLEIAFMFCEKFVCGRSENGLLHLHYTAWLSDNDSKRYRENGVFKFKPTKQ